MPSPTRIVCAGLVLALAATACGVKEERAPKPIPADRLPAASPSAAPSSTVSARGRVWGARDGRLVPVFTVLPGTDPASRIRAVLSLNDLEDGPPTALRDGTRLLTASRSGDTVVVSLSSQLRQVPARDLPLALAQLVFTVTEVPGIRLVHIRAEQVPIVYVDATGRRLARALERSDFAELVQTEAPD